MRSPRGHPIVAATLEWAMRPFQPLRERWIPTMSGRVLEVGAGTGLNFPLYDPTRVHHVVALEPDPHMLRRARARLPGPVPIEVIEGGAEAMPFPDDSFDTIVCAFVLCTIPDLDGALRECARVLRPQGTLHYLEHTRADGRIAKVQDALDPLWGRLAGGCHLNRDPVAHLRRAGFTPSTPHGHGRHALNLTPILRGEARLPTPTQAP